MLDFSEKLSVAKQGKFFRLVADHMIYFYSTFVLMPPSATRNSRLLAMMAIGSGLFAQMLLYEQFEDLEKWTENLKKLIFSWDLFRDYAIFNVAALIQFMISAVLLGVLLSWRLAQVDEHSLANRINSLVKATTQLNWQEETAKLVKDYRSYADGVERNKKFSKYFNFALVAGVIMTIGIFVIDYRERQLLVEG